MYICNIKHFSSVLILFKLLKLNGWSEYRAVIMDEDENNDIKINVNNYLKISENIVGEN